MAHAANTSITPAEHPKTADFENPVLARRRFLTGTAAALGATTLASAGALAAIKSAPDENPALLALGRKLEQAEEAFCTAKARRLQAREQFDQLCPSVPPELVTRKGHYYQYEPVSAEEQDIEGPSFPTLRRKILRAEKMRAYLTTPGAGPRTKIGRNLKPLIKIAEQYEAARSAAAETSGIVAAADELRRADWNVYGLAWDAREIEARTSLGVLIKANIIQASWRVGGGPGAQIASNACGLSLAADIVRLAGKVVRQ